MASAKDLPQEVIQKIKNKQALSSDDFKKPWSIARANAVLINAGYNRLFGK